MLSIDHVVVASPDIDRTNLCICMGANPVVSNGSLMTAPNIKARFKAIHDRGGRIVVIDWKPGELPKGPPPDHKLPAAQVIDEMRAAGFTFAEQLYLLPYQYVLVFRR